MTISEQIKAARKAKGWTQEKLAQAVNKPQQHVQRMEKGTYSIKTIQELADALNEPFTIYPNVTK